jgi:hypothetical protein
MDDEAVVLSSHVFQPVTRLVAVIAYADVYAAGNVTGDYAWAPVVGVREERVQVHGHDDYRYTEVVLYLGEVVPVNEFVGDICPDHDRAQMKLVRCHWPEAEDEGRLADLAGAMVKKLAAELKADVEELAAAKSN